MPSSSYAQSKHGSHASHGSGSLSTSRVPSCQDIKSLSLIRTADDSIKHLKSTHDWKRIIPNAAYFVGYDKYLFGNLLAIVYEDPITEKISTVFIARHGENQYNSLTIDARSRYFPACENLLPEFRKSNVRRALAITALRAYANLDSNLRDNLISMSNSDIPFDWDETTAGDLATSMSLIIDKVPTQIGEKVLELGYLQQKFSNALMLDIVYIDEEHEIDENNKLVFLLGEQLDQLFDPLTEYSPESTEKIYKVPPEGATLKNIVDGDLTKSIVHELIKVQTSFTKNLVQFLQNFVVPLRIRVLNGEIPNLSISKLNLIFPPTIDEITRINCIFLDSLQNAQPYGSFEIFKACGTTIPYFYKAYMRHEAATKNFSSQLTFFFEKFDEYLSSPAGKQRSSFIDIEYFTKRRIDSLIHGSLNLIKLKMILNRLVENNSWPKTSQDLIDVYYKSAINTIDSFGSEKLKPYNNRVFTPTGKLLTELASNWPTELHYGWLTRRVVAIFGGRNLMSNSAYNEDIIIIFSDHVLFMTIDDKSYYKRSIDDSTSTVHAPSISDILMHSLINQIPLNNIPHLTVTGWADIGDVYPSTYNDSKMIQFFVIGAGIKSPFLKDPKIVDSIRKYQIKDVNKLTNGQKIIDLVNKAKILNKSSPFHLFKTQNLGLSIYSTAHEKFVYVNEKSKSPFALFLNMKFTKSILYENNLYAGLSAKFIKNSGVGEKAVTADGSFTNFDAAENSTTIEGDDLIEVFGLTKDGSKIHEILPSSEFSTFLAEQLSNLYSNFLSHKNDIESYLISANDKLTDHLIHYVDESYIPRDSLKEEAEEENEEEQEEQDEGYSGDALSVKHTPQLKVSPSRKRALKLLMGPSSNKLSSSRSEYDVGRHSKNSLSTSSAKPMLINAISATRTASTTTTKATAKGTNHILENEVVEADEEDDEEPEEAPMTKTTHKYHKSKDTLLSVFTSNNDLAGAAREKPLATPKKPAAIDPSKQKTPQNKITFASDVTSSKKKTSFFDKIFRRKPKTPTTSISSPAIFASTQRKVIAVEQTNADKEPTTKISRTLNKIFKSSQNIAESGKTTSKPAISRTSSKESVASYNSTFDHIVNTPYTTPSKAQSRQYQAQSNRRKSSQSTRRTSSQFNTPNERDARKYIIKGILNDDYDEGDEDELDDEVNAISTPVKNRKRTSTYKAQDYKIRSSTSINNHKDQEKEEAKEEEGEFIDNNSSTIRPVVASDSGFTASSVMNGSPISDAHKIFSGSSASNLAYKRSSILSGKDNTRNNSVKSKQSRMSKKQVEFQTDEDNGKENFNYLEEVAKLKLAKENHEHLLSVKNRHKTSASMDVPRTKNGLLDGITRDTIFAESASLGHKRLNSKIGSKESSARNSIFVDDYSDEDEDVARNWVIARENSSLGNIHNVELQLQSKMKSSNSKNWTLTREASSNMNLGKRPFKKTESGFSIYNDLMDESIAPNWIIARDNSTLLNIPKDMSILETHKQPGRSMSRSKNIDLIPYQNKIKSSLNSFKSAQDLDDNQKLYAMLLSQSTFDSQKNLNGNNTEVVEEAEDEDHDDNKYYLTKGGQLSDDEGRFEDDGEDFEDTDDFDNEQDSEHELDDGIDHGKEKVPETRIKKVASSIVNTSANDHDDEEDTGSRIFQSSLIRGTFGYVNSPTDEEEYGLIDEDLLGGFDDDEDDDEDEERDDESFDEPKQHGLMSTLPTMSSFGVDGPGVTRGYEEGDDEDDSDIDEALIPRSVSNLSGGIPRSISFGGHRSQSVFSNLGLPDKEQLKDISESGGFEEEREGEGQKVVEEEEEE